MVGNASLVLGNHVFDGFLSIDDPDPFIELGVILSQMIVFRFFYVRGRLGRQRRMFRILLS